MFLSRRGSVGRQLEIVGADLGRTQKKSRIQENGAGGGQGLRLYTVALPVLLILLLGIHRLSWYLPLY